MRQFVLKQEQKLRQSEPIEDTRNSYMNDRETKNTRSYEEREATPIFTYLEEQVYSYLQAHAGKVCTKRRNYARRLEKRSSNKQCFTEDH